MPPSPGNAAAARLLSTAIVFAMAKKASTTEALSCRATYRATGIQRPDDQRRANAIDRGDDFDVEHRHAGQALLRGIKDKQVTTVTLRGGVWPFGI